MSSLTGGQEEPQVNANIASDSDSPSSAIDTQEAMDEPPPTRNMALIMAALSVASFLAILDISFVTTALPTIAAYFNASQISYSWIGSAYLLTQSAMAPLWGKMSDIFGRKPILLLTTFVFFVGSLLCGTAINIPMLIAGRAIQGAGGGGLLVIVAILIGDLTSARERGLYFGILGVVYAIAISTGPIIGGAIASTIGWRWCFYINLPCDFVAFIIMIFLIDVHDPKTNVRQGLKAVDWLGSLFIIGSVLLLLLGLQYGGETYPWGSATVICLIIFGVVVFGVFIGTEWKLAKYPVIPLRLFTDRAIIALFILDASQGFVMYALAYFMPFYFQVVLDASAIQSAVWFLPSAIVLAIFSIGTGIYMRQTGKYTTLIIVGTALSTLGIGLLIDLPTYVSWPRIILYQIITALGIGPNFQAPALAIQARFPPADAGVSMSAASAIRSLSAAFSIIIGGVIIENRVADSSGQLIAAGVDAGIVAQIAADGASGSSGLVDTLTSAQREIFHGIVRSSLADMWIFFTVMSGIGFVASFFIGRDLLSEEHTEHVTGLATEEANRLVHEKKVPDLEMRQRDS